MELQSFVAFKPTSLDTEFKWKHHCERTLGVHIDLVDLDNADVVGQKLHPADERLLKWDQQNAGNLQAARKDRAFFRKTTFMANDLSRSSALRGAGAREAALRREHVEEEDEGALLLRDAAASFMTVLLKEAKAAEAAAAAEADTTSELSSSSSSSSSSHGATGSKRKLMDHPTKPHLSCEWSLPLLPDTTTWANHYRYVGFDDDPSVNNQSNTAAAAAAAAAASQDNAGNSQSSSKRTKQQQAAVLSGLIVNAKNEYSARAQDTILTGSLIVPSSSSAVPNCSEGRGDGEEEESAAPFEWKRQYQMNMEKVATAEALRGNLLLFVDPTKGVVTYKDLAPQKVRHDFEFFSCCAAAVKPHPPHFFFLV
jgi:hypothetical protein